MYQNALLIKNQLSCIRPEFKFLSKIEMAFFNISHKMMIELTPIVSRSKTK